MGRVNAKNHDKEEHHPFFSFLFLPGLAGYQNIVERCLIAHIKTNTNAYVLFINSSFSYTAPPNPLVGFINRLLTRRLLRNEQS